jgi:hypothetical protein
VTDNRGRVRRLAGLGARATGPVCEYCGGTDIKPPLDTAKSRPALDRLIAMLDKTARRLEATEPLGAATTSIGPPPDGHRGNGDHAEEDDAR